MSLSRGIVILVMTMMLSTSGAQQFGLSLPQDSTYARMAFNLNNNIMTVSAALNGRVWLTLIVDTSVEHTIINNKEIAEQYGVNLLRKIELGNSADGPLYGYAANGAELEFQGGVYTGNNHSLMVLEYDFLELSTTAQIEVHGIVGRDFFGRFVVDIDIDNQVLTLWEPEAFQVPPDYEGVPVKFEDGEAKISVTTTFQNWEELQEYYIIKTGTPHTILYDNSQNVYNIPFKNIETTLGKGGGGELNGHVGRTRTIGIGESEFEEPVASFTSQQVAGKNRGSVGMGLLSRFNLIVDYHGGTLFLKPNRSFNKAFEYDMSGIKISPDGGNFFVSYVQKGSPAAKAGLQVGDRVLSINGDLITAENFTQVTSIFTSKPDKKISMKILQRGVESEINFRLVRFI